MKINRLENVEKRVKEIVEYAIYGQEVEMSVAEMMELIKEEIDYENSINQTILVEVKLPQTKWWRDNCYR